MAMMMQPDLDQLFTELVVKQQQSNNRHNMMHSQMASIPEQPIHEMNPFTSPMPVSLEPMKGLPVNVGFPSPVSPEFMMDQSMLGNSTNQVTGSIPAGSIDMSNVGMMDPYYFDANAAFMTAPISAQQQQMNSHQMMTMDDSMLMNNNAASMYFAQTLDRRASFPRRRDSVASVAYSVMSDTMSTDFPVSSLAGSTKAGPMRRASVAGTSVFQCKEAGCFRTFNRLQNLKSHARCHLKISPHACPSCSHSFRRSTDLARHIRTVHALDTDKPWGCEACGKKFGRSDALKRHQASKSKLYGCPASRNLEDCGEEESLAAVSSFANAPFNESSSLHHGMLF